MYVSLFMFFPMCCSVENSPGASFYSELAHTRWSTNSCSKGTLRRGPVSVVLTLDSSPGKNQSFPRTRDKESFVHPIDQVWKTRTTGGVSADLGS